MWKILVAGGLAVTLAGCAGTANDAPAGTDQDRRAEKVTLVPDGPAQNCVPINTIRSTDVRDDNTIDFRMTNGKIYRNTLPNRCPGLKSERSFTYSTSLSQLCSTDIITVIHQGAGPWRGASCGLGDFQPMKKAEATGADTEQPDASDAMPADAG